MNENSHTLSPTWGNSKGNSDANKLSNPLCPRSTNDCIPLSNNTKPSNVGCSTVVEKTKKVVVSNNLLHKQNTNDESSVPLLNVVKGLCQYSPNGAYAAFANGTKVVVFSSPKDLSQPLETVRHFNALENIDLLEWSSDSSIIMCAHFKSAKLQIFSLRDKKWICRVTEGEAGLVHASLAPDSKHVLTVADFQMHLTVWSLVTQEQFFVDNPKLCVGSCGYDFDSNGQFLAVLRRCKCKDSVAIYNANGGWRQLIHFAIGSTDAEEIAWDPYCETIAIRDSAIEYLVLAYSPSTGDLLGRFVAYDDGLGARCMAWANNDDFLAVGSFDGIARVLSSVTWRPILECHHPATVCTRTCKLIHITLDSITKYNNIGDDIKKSSIADLSSSQIHKFKLMKTDPKRDIPRAGVASIQWNFDSSFLVTRDEEKPNVVWIWKPKQFDPYVVLDFSSRVHSVKWSPCNNRLAIATGQAFVYIWQPVGNESSQVTKSTLHSAFEQIKSHETVGVRWNPDGENLLLVGKAACLFAAYE